MLHVHTAGVTCPHCSPPFSYTPKPIILNPHAPAVLRTAYPPETVSSDCLEGAFHERRRIVDALRDAGHADLAGKIDRGEL
jgi:hypothetical protein